MSVHVHIERLILDGLPVRPGDAAWIQAAMEAELVRLLAENGIPDGWRQGGSQARVEAPMLRLPASPDAKALGMQVGAGVHGAITGKTANGDGGTRK